MVNPQQSDSTQNAPPAQSQQTPAPHSEASHVDASRVLSANGTTIGRVDSAHLMQRVDDDQAVDGDQPSAAILPEMKQFPELDALSTGQNVSTPTGLNSSTDLPEVASVDLAEEDVDEETALLIQASKIARNVRARSAEIAVREQKMNELQSRLEQQQEQAAVTETELQSRNTDLARRIGEFAERRHELETRFTELDQAFAELNGERSKIRNELQAELSSDFKRLERERVEFREQVQQHSTEHEAAILSVRQTLESERQQLKAQLDAEMQRRVGELQADRERWESDWKHELGRVEEYRKSAESEIESLKQDLAEREADAVAQQQRSDEARRDLESAHQAFREDKEIVDGFEAREREIAESRAKLNSERQALRAEIEADLAAQFVELKQQRESWANQSTTERLQLDHELQQLRTQFDQQQTEWESEYKVAAQALQQREQQLTDRTRQLEKLGGELEEVKQELTSRAAELEDRVHGSRAEIDRERREALADVEAQRKSFVDNLDAEKLSHDEKLLEERREFENERDTLRLQMQQHENVLRNRFRFQQEHLQNTRLDLEAAQRRLRHDVQLQRAHEAEQIETLRLRRRNLDQYRTLQEERELSLERERTLILKARKSERVELDRDRDGLASERTAWQHEADARKSEIRRQQDMLAAHAENLEMRRKRLDALRTELETTHRTTLETRMAVEEAWAQLTQATDPDTARDRVEAARNALTEHYGHLREALTLQRQELEDAQALFQRQKDDFRGERQTLTVWVSERDEKLRMWEERLNKDSSALESSEQKWRSARDGWVHEKLEAESVIRSLLKQITELTRATGREAEFPSQPHSVPPAVSDDANIASIVDPRD